VFSQLPGAACQQTHDFMISKYCVIYLPLAVYLSINIIGAMMFCLLVSTMQPFMTISSSMKCTASKFFIICIWSNSQFTAKPRGKKNCAAARQEPQTARTHI
jgi:hypothetical protein